MAHATEEPSLVAMIPLRRCGSHAIRLRLNMSPELVSPYPLHAIDYLPIVAKNCNLQDVEHWKTVIRDVVGLQKTLMVPWNGVDFQEDAVVNELIDHPKRSVHTVVAHLLKAYGKANSAKVVIDKSLDCVHYAGEYMEVCPDMKFIHIVRDPRAQVSSMKEAIIHEFSTLGNALLWVDAYEKAERLVAQYPTRCVSIRFEDFIHDQASVFKKICRFLNIQFLPEMLDISKSAEASDLSQKSALWENNARNPMAGNIDKFRKKLSDNEIQVIESLCGHLMEKYGYQKMFPDIRIEVTDKMRADASEQSEAGRAEAWKALERDEEFPKDYELRKHRKEFLASCALHFEPNEI